MVKLRSGEIIIDKYLETRRGFMVFEEHGKINKDEIAMATIYKEKMQ